MYSVVSGRALCDVARASFWLRLPQTACYACAMYVKESRVRFTPMTEPAFPLPHPPSDEETAEPFSRKRSKAGTAEGRMWGAQGGTLLCDDGSELWHDTL